VDRIEETLPAAAPGFLTHLALDKHVYRPGEIVFFRSATLEADTLRPPSQPVSLEYSLVGPRGKVVYRFRGQTQDGGIGGGEFPLSTDVTEGEYTLRVVDSEGRVPPEERRLLVHRAGAVIATRSKQPVIARPTVEFFPEGGELLASVPNRVYFRLRTPSGTPAVLSGAIVDGRDEVVARVETARGAAVPSFALGVFTFTPKLGEDYRLRATTPADLVAPLPVAREVGLALSVPAAVTPSGQPLRVVLSLQDTRTRRLVVAAFCRGRLVAQEPLTARPGTTEVSLTPPEEAGAGVLRITVFERAPVGLQPLAERLVYRVPPRRLELSADSDKERYQGGEQVRLTVHAKTERGDPAEAWLLVAVVDAQAAGVGGGPGETSLPAQFYLTSQLRQPEDLERADLVVRDDPASARALDLFLGTQGWRRFIVRDEPAVAVAATGPARPSDALLRLDNARGAQGRYDKAFAAEQARIRLTFADRDRGLNEERARCGTVLGQTRTALETYEARVRAYSRLALGAAVLTLFAVGCVALVIGLVRVATGRQANVPYFATAFATLVVCLLTFVAFSGQQVPNGGGDILAHLPEKPGGPAAGPRDDGHPAATITAATTGPGERALPRSEDLQLLERRIAETDRQRKRPGLRKDKEFTQRFADDLAALRQSGGARPVEPGPGRATPATVGRGPATGDIPLLQPYAHPILREYARLGDYHETVFWYPTFKIGRDGKAVLPEFTLSDSGSAYRILIYGHTPSGRLGVFAGVIDSTPRAAPAAR
jgi:hypothetical protein